MYTCPAQADRDLNSPSGKEAAAEGGGLHIIGIDGTVHKDLLITQKSGRGTDMRLPMATTQAGYLLNFNSVTDGL